MSLKNIHNNQDMNLVASGDAKPRLKWTPELHQRFVNAVAHSGGIGKATPKSLMRVMGIHGLTLYHLKSHLQKYRLGKSQQSQTCIDNDPDQDVECEVNQRSHAASRNNSDRIENQIDESLQIAQTLRTQMEAQRKLHDQTEVQRRLQLRIEAQGRYLQCVLKKAQDTLSEYNSSYIELDYAKAELSQLLSMVDNGCKSSCLSAITKIKATSLNDTDNKSLSSTNCSVESSLTSSEGSAEKGNSRLKHDFTNRANTRSSNLKMLSLTEMTLENKSKSTEQTIARKRSGSTISDGFYYGEQPCSKRPKKLQPSDDHMKRGGLVETFDLNSTTAKLDPLPFARVCVEVTADPSI